MTSQPQLEANRQNAQLSTGPRTLEGKRRTRLNATRHGLTGQVTAMNEHDRAAHDRFCDRFVADLKPATTLELNLAHLIATDTWRIHRIHAIEENLFALGMTDPDCAVECDDHRTQPALSAARVFEKQAHQLQLLSLYEQRINRNLHKNLQAFRELQAERKWKEPAPKAARKPEIHALPGAATAASANTGFVFSNREIDPKTTSSPSEDSAHPTLKQAA